MTCPSPTRLFCLLLAAALPAGADLGAEARAATLPRSAVDARDRPVELPTPHGSVVALHRARQRGDGRGGVVLLHDLGAGPDSLTVMRPLREGLAEAGWDTLSLPLPQVAAHRGRAAWQADAERIEARLAAGLGWFDGRGLPNQVIVAHGASAAQAVAFAAAQTAPGLRAVVLISATWRPADAETRLRVPLLDIYAERDAAAVIDAAAARRSAAMAERNSDYRQVVVPGALPGFHATEGNLLARVRAWLSAYADGAARGAGRGRE